MNFITNLLEFARHGFVMGSTHGGKRQVWEVLGYPETLCIKDFRDKYKRGDIATRIVDAYPNACWSNIPFVVEDEKEQDVTPWEKKTNDFLKELDFWKHVRKLDKLVNLGSYAVLYIGFNDGANLENPVSRGVKPVFLKPLAEDVAKIESYVKDVSDKRFGLPLFYELAIKDGTSVKVHYSRVIHVAERSLDDETSGQSILQHIWNKLIDLEKITGGSAEIFWLNARAGLSLEADAEADLGDEEDKKKLKDEIEAYQHNLTRIIRTKGLAVKVLSQDVKSPKDQFDICLSIIAGSTGIPKRILLGTESGELASSQDENNWNNQVQERRSKFCEPHILNAFINYMIELGFVDKLDKEYSWEWPSLVSISPKDKAEIASKKSAALVGYANSVGADLIIPPQQFVEEILEMKFRQDEVAKLIAEENAAIDKSLTNDPNNQDPNVA